MDKWISFNITTAEWKQGSFNTTKKHFYITGSFNISAKQQTQSVFHTIFTKTQILLANITGLPAGLLKSFGSVPHSKFISCLSKEQPSVRGQLLSLCIVIWQDSLVAHSHGTESAW